MKNKSKTYPFTPKSNAYLEKGEFWAIALSNGKYGCGIILDIPKRGLYTTKSFFIGLLDWIGDNKPNQADLERKPIKLLKQYDASIKTITVHNEQILGKIDLEQNNIEIFVQVNIGHCSIHSRLLKGYEDLGEANEKDYEILTVQATAGYRVINLLAEKYLVKI
jgi:hypothetical protein